MEISYPLPPRQARHKKPKTKTRKKKRTNNKFKIQIFKHTINDNEGAFLIKINFEMINLLSPQLKMPYKQNKYSWVFRAGATA